MRAQKMHGSDIQALLVSQGGGSSGLSREQQVLGRAQLLDEMAGKNAALAEKETALAARDGVIVQLRPHIRSTSNAL